MAGFLSAAISAIGASSIGSAVVRILVAYGISRLINGSTNKQNAQSQDAGVRLQLAPNTTNPIPLLFGSAYFGGNITDAQLSSDNKTLWTVITLSEHDANNRLSDNAAVTTTVDEVYWNNQLITFKNDGFTVDRITNSDGTVDYSASGLAEVHIYKNGSSTPQVGTTPAYSLMPGWTTAHTMTNLTFAIVKLTYNRDKGVVGLPEFKFKVSNNLYKPGDAIYSYLRNRISGANLSVAEIDTASLTALNDYADDSVSYLDESDNTVKTLSNRYQINGLINPEKTVMENLQSFANSTGCYIKYDIAQGKWGVRINRDASPIADFNDSNIISGIDVSGTELTNQYNAIEISYPHRQIQDQTDTVRINLPAEWFNANEPDNVLNVTLDMLNEPLQARELAYLELYQNRMDRVVTFTTDYSKINLEAGDVITVTSSVYDWTAQPFRIIRIKEIETETGGLAVEITAQEYDSTVYTAGGQPRRPRVPTSPITLPSIGVIGTPAAPTFVEANNNRLPSVLLTGVTPNVGIVDRFEFWMSSDNFATSTLVGLDKNTNGSPYNGGTTLLYRLSDLPAGTYKFKVRAGNDSAFSEYSPASAELSWNPVQTTDQVSASTGFKISSLLPVLGAGAIAYFAYKALYPEIMEALSATQLGQLLGIESPTQAALIKDKLEQEKAAFKIVTAGGVQMSPEVDNSITFVAGDGIDISVDSGTHDITISVTGGAGSGFTSVSAGEDTINSADVDGSLTFVAGTGIKFTTDTTTGSIKIDNTCCAEDNTGTSEEIIDYGEPKVRKLDNCEKTITLPAKTKVYITPATPAIPEGPATFAYVTGAGTFYDPCYKTTVPTIVIPQLTVDSGIVEHLSNHVYKDYDSILWNGGAHLIGKKIRMISVGNHNFIAMKNWVLATGARLPAHDEAAACMLNPSERPLFPSVDYPSGYEFMTYAELQTVLESTAQGLKFQSVPGTPAVPAKPEVRRTITYPGETVPVVLARTHIEGYETIKSYGTPVAFNGIITGTSLLTDGTAVPIGALIGGTYTNNKDKISILGATRVVSLVSEGTGYKIYTINNRHTTASSILDADRIAMNYKVVTTELVTTELTRDANVS